MSLISKGLKDLSFKIIHVRSNESKDFNFKIMPLTGHESDFNFKIMPLTGHESDFNFKCKKLSGGI